MQRLEFNGAVRLIYKSLGVKGLIRRGYKPILIIQKTEINIKLGIFNNIYNYI